jgi:hypothetical protein
MLRRGSLLGLLDQQAKTGDEPGLFEIVNIHPLR